MAPTENKHPIPLAERLRHDARQIETHIGELQQRFDREQRRIAAFMPETGRFDRVRRDAERLVTRYPQEDGRPALFGVPVGVKDIIHVDGLPTTAGSRLPPTALAGPQATCVTRLLDAGALVLGKTVSTEFAYFGPGPTRNPHNPEHTPGGSSSGSAAAVAAGLCPLALGSQTVGSVIRPAAFCGVVGFKPTFGRIPIDGVIPYAPTVDTLGVFAGDVAGAVVAVAVLSGRWGETPPIPQPLTVGVPQGPYLEQTDAEGLAHFDAVVARLGNGCDIQPVDALADLNEIAARHQDLIAAEFALGQHDWFEQFGDLYQPITAEQIRYGRTVTPQRLAACRQGPAKLRAELDALMTEHGLDAWICPAATGAAPRGIDSTGDPAMNMPWTHAQVPVVSIPSGWTESGLPLGLQIAGRFGKDEDLTLCAAMIEAILAAID